jgi:hypothetical protein
MAVLGTPRKDQAMLSGQTSLAEVSMRDSSSLARTSAVAFCEAKSSDVEILPSPRLEFFLAVLAELGRALAAARRHESLRYGRGRQGGIAPADIPRQIFEEFYAIQLRPEDAAGPEPAFSSEASAHAGAERMISRMRPVSSGHGCRLG